MEFCILVYSYQRFGRTIDMKRALSSGGDDPLTLSRHNAVIGYHYAADFFQSPRLMCDIRALREI